MYPRPGHEVPGHAVTITSGQTTEAPALFPAELGRLPRALAAGTYSSGTGSCTNKVMDRILLGDFCTEMQAPLWHWLGWHTDVGNTWAKAPILVPSATRYLCRLGVHFNDLGVSVYYGDN